MLQPGVYESLLCGVQSDHRYFRFGHGTAAGSGSDKTSHELARLFANRQNRRPPYPAASGTPAALLCAHGAGFLTACHTGLSIVSANCRASSIMPV